MRLSGTAALLLLFVRAALTSGATDFSATVTVTSLSGSGPGSLAEVISAAQQSGIPTRINSSVAGTIVLNGSLPTINVPLWLGSFEDYDFWICFGEGAERDPSSTDTLSGKILNSKQASNLLHR